MFNTQITKFFILFLIFFSPLSYAQERVNTSTSSCSNYSEQELDILKKLSERHLQLLKKEEALNKKEKELKAKEDILVKKMNSLNLSTEERKKQAAQIYMNLPPSKAVNLLNTLTVEETADILQSMPKTISSLLLNKMDFDRAESILKHMTSQRTE